MTRTKVQRLGTTCLFSVLLVWACTDNEPSRTLEQGVSDDTGGDGSGTGARPSGGASGSGTGGSSMAGSGTGGSSTAGSSTGGTAGAGGGDGTDPCLSKCVDPEACTPEEQLLVDFCHIYAKRCPDQPADVLMDPGPGDPIPAGPDVPSTATRPQLGAAEADDYTLEKAFIGGGVYAAHYSGDGEGGMGAGGAGSGPLGERTLTYETDSWDPTGPIEDVTKIVPGIVVDPNGDPMTDGTYKTIGSAITAAGATAGCPRVFIKVLPGRYHEKIIIPNKDSAPPITIYGADRDPTKIVIYRGDSAAGAEGDGTPLTIHNSAVFTNSLPQPFQARNLTIQNTYVKDTFPGDPDEQTAVALNNQADKALFDNVRILGHRNALYVKSEAPDQVSRIYLRNCYIEGDEDIILGRGVAVIDQSRIHSLGDETSGGSITAPSTVHDQPHGILIINSELTADARVTNVYLGHQWPESNSQVGKTIVRNSILGAHIRSTDVWAPSVFTTPKNPTPTSQVLYGSDDYYAPGTGLIPPETYVAEFGNSGPGAAQEP